MLAKVIDSNHTTWQNHLTQVQLASSTSYHESIGDIPYRVIFKEMPRTLLQAAADSVCRITEHKTTSPMAYVENSLTSVPDIYQRVKKIYSHRSNERQRQYNKSKLHFTPYSVGDLVWITRPSGGKQISRSFCPRWMEPYKVVEKISDVVYKVRRPYVRKDVTLHHDRIKPYVQRNLRFKDIRTNVNQQREILSDISTDSEDNPEELPNPVESDSNSSTEAPQVLRRSQRQRSRPQYLNDYIVDSDFSARLRGSDVM